MTTQAHSDEARAAGELALLLGNAVRSRNLELLRSVVHEVGEQLSFKEGKWIFRTVQLDLTLEQQLWLKEAIAQIRAPEEL